MLLGYVPDITTSYGVLFPTKAPRRLGASFLPAFRYLSDPAAHSSWHVIIVVFSGGMTVLVLVARHRSADKGSYVCRHRISFSGDGACVWVGGVGLSLEGVEWSVICSAGRRDFV